MLPWKCGKWRMKSVLGEFHPTAPLLGANADSVVAMSWITWTLKQNAAAFQKEQVDFLKDCYQRVSKWKEISAVAMSDNTLAVLPFRQDGKVVPEILQKWARCNDIEPYRRDGALWSVFGAAANEGSSSTRGWLRSTEKRGARPQTDW